MDSVILSNIQGNIGNQSVSLDKIVNKNVSLKARNA
jgi:hypothetical protein